MEVNNTKKILTDKDNKYFFDDNNVVAFLNNNKDFRFLKRCSNKGYSIKANFLLDDRKESLVLINYSILETKDVDELKESNRFKMFLLDKLKIKSSKEGGLIIFNYEKIATKNKIRYIRQEMEMTQKELADKVGVSRRTISSLENGYYNPSLELAHDIVVALGCSTIEEVFKFY